VNGKKVLDSYALLAYLNKEKGYDKVKSLLSSEKAVLLMNDINIGEAFYVISRNRGFEKAEYFVNTILKSLPLSTVGNTFHEVLEAGLRHKSGFPGLLFFLGHVIVDINLQYKEALWKR